MSRTQRFLGATAALFSAAVALASYRYLAGAGPVPPNVGENTFFQPWMMLHVAGAATALLLGPWQFLAGLRSRRPQVHRWIGRVYVLCCLFGGVSGLLLALGSTAGPIATAGFGLLGIAWIATTARGWQLARQRRFRNHREWMIRSFALSFAAVTLRIYLPLPSLLGIDFLPAYQAISFLCWVPNLLVAEWWLRTRGLSATSGLRRPA
ncbi:MAG TPA: DUF2306 domain-containing protein [Variovorax sp.]|nr:DUF2306 domain-containing protein [Variovorax sp.]